MSKNTDLTDLGRSFVNAVLSRGSFAHYGIKGQRHGVRRFQNEDGSLTPEGERRYLVGDNDGRKDSVSGTAAQLKLNVGRKEQDAKNPRFSNADYEPNGAEQDGKNKKPDEEDAINGYEPGTTELAGFMMKNSRIDFGKYEGPDGKPFGREDLMGMTDEVLWNFGKGHSDKDIADYLTSDYGLDVNDSKTFVKMARGYYQSARSKRP